MILPCDLKRINQGKVLVIGSSENHAKNEGVIVLLKKAWKWSEDIENEVTTKEIAKQEKVSVSYVGKVLRLRFLSPKI